MVEYPTAGAQLFGTQKAKDGRKLQTAKQLKLENSKITYSVGDYAFFQPDNSESSDKKWIGKIALIWSVPANSPVFWKDTSYSGILLWVQVSQKFTTVIS